MSVYPRNMSTFLNRMTNYNKNNVKMTVLGTPTANDGDVIQVDLPTNSIVDLSSLAWSFQVAYTGAAGKPDPAGVNGSLTFPLNAESIISRLAVEVNGQTLVNLQNYNQLYHALLYMTATQDYQHQRRVAQSNVAGGATNGTTLQSISASATVVTETRRHVIDTWLGFLGSAKPMFIDTSLLGNVRISITLAGADIIGLQGAATSDTFARSYVVSDQAFSMDVVSIGDGFYDSMVDQMLASGAPIEIPFKNYFSFNGNLISGEVPFTVASQSIDRLWAVIRANSFSDAAASNADKLVALDNAGDSDIVKATPAAFTYTSNGHQNFAFRINNTNYPQWTSTNKDDWWQHTKLALGDQGNMLAGSFVNNTASYINNFFVYACQLEHHAGNDERFLSGIDTRGSAAQCYFTASGGNSGNPCTTTVFAECSSSLKIYAGKVLEIVQ